MTTDNTATSYAAQCRYFADQTDDDNPSYLSGWRDACKTLEAPMAEADATIAGLRAKLAEAEGAVGRLLPYARREAHTLKPPAGHYCGDPDACCDGECAAYAGVVADIAAARAAAEKGDVKQ